MSEAPIFWLIVFALAFILGVASEGGPLWIVVVPAVFGSLLVLGRYLVVTRTLRRQRPGSSETPGELPGWVPWVLAMSEALIFWLIVFASVFVMGVGAGDTLWIFAAIFGSLVILGRYLIKRRTLNDQWTGAFEVPDETHGIDSQPRRLWVPLIPFEVSIFWLIVFAGVFSYGIVEGEVFLIAPAVLGSLVLLARYLLVTRALRRQRPGSSETPGELPGWVPWVLAMSEVSIFWLIVFAGVLSYGIAEGEVFLIVPAVVGSLVILGPYLIKRRTLNDQRTGAFGVSERTGAFGVSDQTRGTSLRRSYASDLISAGLPLLLLGSLLVAVSASPSLTGELPLPPGRAHAESTTVFFIGLITAVVGLVNSVVGLVTAVVNIRSQDRRANGRPMESRGTHGVSGYADNATRRRRNPRRPYRGRHQV